MNKKITIKGKQYFLYFKIGRDIQDPEKAVLPTIIVISSNHYSFANLKRKGFMICIGWWDYSIKIGLFL